MCLQVVGGGGVGQLHVKNHSCIFNYEELADHIVAVLDSEQFSDYKPPLPNGLWTEWLYLMGLALCCWY
jgi:hypothetical protein